MNLYTIFIKCIGSIPQSSVYKAMSLQLSGFNLIAICFKITKIETFNILGPFHLFQFFSHTKTNVNLLRKKVEPMMCLRQFYQKITQRTGLRVFRTRQKGLQAAVCQTLVAELVFRTIFGSVPDPFVSVPDL